MKFFNEITKIKINFWMKFLLIFILGACICRSVPKKEGHPSTGFINFHHGSGNIKKASVPVTPQHLKHSPASPSMNSNDLPTLEDINRVQNTKKTETTPNNQGTYVSQTKQKTSYTPSPTKDEGYFQKTSRQNRNTAWEALAAFVCGFILFWVSISFICWNERHSVKEYNYTCWLEENLQTIPIEEVKSATQDKTYIVTGPLNVTQNATCPELEPIISKFVMNDDKLVCLKILVEEELVMEQESSNSGEEEQELVRDSSKSSWYEVPSTYHCTLKSNTFYGQAKLGDGLKLDICDSRINKNFDLKKLQLDSNDSSTLITYLQKLNNYPKFEFNGEHVLMSFNNSEGKQIVRRACIMYYQIKAGESHNYTAFGEISKDCSLVQKDTKMHDAAWSCCLCCFGETSESNKLCDLEKGAVSKEEYVKQKRANNEMCTNILRLVGFLMHFLSYYLILYPLILLLGMIPFLGAVAATVLVIFAFLFALVTFLFIIACAWICARPVLAICIFSVMFVFIFLSKKATDKYGDKNHSDTYSRLSKTKFL
jgi:hypothetical protein